MLSKLSTMLCMKSILKKHYKIIFSLVLFGSIFIFHYPFSKLIVLMLEFIIILEVVKMTDEFLKNGKIRLRHIIDSFIIFIIRDIVVYLSHETKDKETILFLSLMVFIFFIFRILSLVMSPSKFTSKKVIIK